MNGTGTESADDGLSRELPDRHFSSKRVYQACRDGSVGKSRMIEVDKGR